MQPQQTVPTSGSATPQQQSPSQMEAATAPVQQPQPQQQTQISTIIQFKIDSLRSLSADPGVLEMLPDNRIVLTELSRQDGSRQRVVFSEPPSNVAFRLLNYGSVNLFIKASNAGGKDARYYVDFLGNESGEQGNQDDAHRQWWLNRLAQVGATYKPVNRVLFTLGVIGTVIVVLVVTFIMSYR